MTLCEIADGFLIDHYYQTYKKMQSEFDSRTKNTYVPYQDIASFIDDIQNSENIIRMQFSRILFNSQHSEHKRLNDILNEMDEMIRILREIYKDRLNSEKDINKIIRDKDIYIRKTIDDTLKSEKEVAGKLLENELSLITECCPRCHTYLGKDYFYKKDCPVCDKRLPGR